MTNVLRSRAAWLLPFALVACMCGPLMAGTLDDFEGEATETAKPDTVAEREAEPAEDGWSGCWRPGFDAVMRIAWRGGVSSWMRMRPPGPADTLRIERRTPGELQIPVVSLDLRYQDVDSDVSAIDARVEAGYGPLAVAFRYTHYEEENPSDELDITQWHGLYRMSFSEYVGLDVGFGSMALRGDRRHSGFSATLPLRIGFGIPVALVFRPTWSDIGENPITDYDLALLYSRRYFSVCAGYRWFEAGESALNGVFAGVSAQL